MYYSKYHKQRKKKKFMYNLSLVSGVLVLILAWPLSFILPPSAGFENEIIENLQIIVLLFSGIYNLFLTFESTNEKLKSFNLWCSALSIFLACRELSWGRIFYQIGIEKTGPVFVDMSNYIWRTEAYAFIITYMLILFAFMIFKLPLLKMLYCTKPFLIIFLMILAIVFSYIGDHGLIVGKVQGQIIEEFGELAFYSLIPALCIHYCRELSHYN